MVLPIFVTSSNCEIYFNSGCDGMLKSCTLAVLFCLKRHRTHHWRLALLVHIQERQEYLLHEI